MIVSELIEWLKTMPQDAVVQVLEHHSGTGYYDQGGSCYITDFTTDCKDSWVNSAGEHIAYGEHFELECFKGQHTLTLGVRDK